MSIYLGMDPGPTNTGVAVFGDGFKLTTKVVRVKTSKGLKYRMCYEEIFNMMPDLPTCVTIERFVPYKGVPTDHAEVINQFIGYLIAQLHDYSTVRTIRAVSWKSQLCKYQFYKNKFRNPSDSFDKTYSFAVVEDIFGDSAKELKTDHEADAACLAYVGHLRHNEKVKFDTIRF